MLANATQSTCKAGLTSHFQTKKILLSVISSLVLIRSIGVCGYLLGVLKSTVKQPREFNRSVQLHSLVVHPQAPTNVVISVQLMTLPGCQKLSSQVLGTQITCLHVVQEQPSKPLWSAVLC